MRRGTRAASATSAAVVVALLSGCQGGVSDTSDTSDSSTPSGSTAAADASASAAPVASEPADGPVAYSATSTVVLTDDAGTEVAISYDLASTEGFASVPTDYPAAHRIVVDAVGTLTVANRSGAAADLSGLSVAAFETVYPAGSAACPQDAAFMGFYSFSLCSALLEGPFGWSPGEVAAGASATTDLATAPSGDDPFGGTGNFLAAQLPESIAAANEPLATVLVLAVSDDERSRWRVESGSACLEPYWQDDTMLLHVASDGTACASLFG